MERWWIAIAGLSGITAVGADAAARHVLAGDPHRAELVATGAHYSLLHAVALMAVAALAAGSWGRGRRGGGLAAWLVVAGWCFAAGVVLFSGSLYWLADGGPAAVARATPLGGILLIAGWAALLVHAVSARPAG